MNKYFFIGIVVIIVTVVIFLITNTYWATKNASKHKITVLLDWVPNTNHTGLYVAKEKGYYTDENLDVQFIQPGEGDAEQIVASGKVDFAISGQESVTLARAKDIPVVSVAAIMQHNTSAFASLKSANVKTMKDFEDKRYGGWGSPIEKAVIESAMNDDGADYNKLKFITLGSADFNTSIGRDSDIEWIFYGWEGIEARLKGRELNFIMLKDLNPVLDYYTPVIITNEKHINSQKDIVARFMKATAKGYEFSSKNPKESATLLIKSAPELNHKLVNDSQNWISSQYTADATQWGIQKNEVWKRYADWLYAHKQIDKNIDTQKAFTNEFLPKE